MYMTKQKIIQSLRALRKEYATDGVTVSEMEKDLKDARFPTGVVTTAVSAYKNAATVAALPSGGSRLSSNELARIALNTAIGSAKRNLFGSF